MKGVNIKVWEISRDEVFLLPDKTQVLIYNTLFKDFKLIQAGRLIFMLSKLSKFHVFFTLNEPDFNSFTKTLKNKKKKRAWNRDKKNWVFVDVL